jgi:ABC-type hemin transport system ATPase subunit
VKAGAVHFEGKRPRDVEAHELVAMGMALSPEGRAIFPNLTVRENLEMGAYTVRDPARSRAAWTQAVALFPRLGERMAQLGGTLSGGEQQMLAIARALMSRPEAPDARRALARHRAGAGRSDLRGHRAASARRGPPSCSSSRTPAARSPRRSARTCW